MSAMDDFGTGYSSLAYIQKFPINHLKINRSFIKGLPTDMGNKTLTEIIVMMGRKIGMSIIAEGVETIDQNDYLETLDIDLAQGFLYGKPMTSDRFSEYLIEFNAIPVIT